MPAPWSHVMKQRRAVYRIQQRAFKTADAATLNELDAQLLDIAEDLTNRNEQQEDGAGAVLASTYHVLSELYARMSRWDEMIEAIDRAMAGYREHAPGSLSFGTFLFDSAVSLYDYSHAPQPALDLAREALSIFSTSDRGRWRLCETFVNNMQSLLPDEDASPRDPKQDDRRRQERIDDSRDRLRYARRRDRADAANELATRIYREGQGQQLTTEMHDATEFAVRQYIEERRYSDAVGALGLLVDLYWDEIPLPPDAPALTDQLLSLIEPEGQREAYGHCLIVKAYLLATDHQTTASTDAALHAIAQLEQAALQSGSVTTRWLRSRNTDLARELAICNAIQGHDATLAAELIECTRFQVHLDTTSPAAPQSHSRVTGLRPVAVNGQSRMQPHYHPDIRADAIDLEAALARATPQPHDWWGTWVISGRSYWAARIDNQWDCGYADFQPGTPLRELLDDALIPGMNLANAPDMNTILPSGWSRSALAEELTATSLGAHLIPEPLQDKLRRNHHTGTVTNLVIAGNLPALVPVAPLGVPQGSPAKNPIRIIEAATLRTSPPVSLIDAVPDHTPHHATRDILLACVDPTNDLDFSGTPPTDAHQVLTGRSNNPQERPTLATITSALRDITPAQPGILFYSGHASSDGPASDQDDALVLADGDALTATYLFTQPTDRLHIPDRVILSACSSGGLAGTGAGEWLGLAAALIHRGARQVIATSWPIYDTPFTTHFDNRICQLTQRLDDTAEVLRTAQLEALELWRAAGIEGFDLTDGRLPGRHAELALPVIWASYAAVIAHT